MIDIINKILSDPNFIPRSDIMSLDLKQFSSVEGVINDILNQLSKEECIAFAVGEAELVLPIWEARYSLLADDRPKKAIEAARAWLASDAADAAEAAKAAAEAAKAALTARCALRDAVAAAYYAANANAWAADAVRAADAALAAYYAALATSAAYTAYYAAGAANAAGRAIGAADAAVEQLKRLLKRRKD